MICFSFVFLPSGVCWTYWICKSIVVIKIANLCLLFLQIIFDLPSFLRFQLYECKPDIVLEVTETHVHFFPSLFLCFIWNSFYFHVFNITFFPTVMSNLLLIPTNVFFLFEIFYISRSFPWVVLWISFFYHTWFFLYFLKNMEHIYNNFQYSSLLILSYSSNSGPISNDWYIFLVRDLIFLLPYTSD